MGMPYVVIVAATACEGVVNDIAGAVFDHANGFLNAWNPESEVSLLNREKPGSTMPLSTDLARVFDVVDHAFNLSQGRFDPTTGVLNVAFENCIREKGRPPLPAEITPFKHAIGWKRRIQRASKSVARGNANTVVDLDGVAKGFVIDMLVGALLRQGFSNCYVDWAGDIRAEGRHPSGRPWRSAVMRPPPLRRVFGHWKDGTMKELLQQDDVAFYADFCADSDVDGEERRQGAAIATSGDYFAVQKYGYHHIARPDTLTVMKANRNSIGTVCVAAKTCALADALATAAMTFDGVDEAIDFLHNLTDTHRDTVYGYCVMDRNDSPNAPRKKAYTESIFAPVRVNEDNSGSGSETLSDGRGSEQFAKLVNNIYHYTVTNNYRCSFNGVGIELDNFRACSMEPEQIVSFVTSREFVQSASLSEEDERNCLSVEVLTPLPQTEPSTLSADRNTGVKIDLAFKRISVVHEGALVEAVVRNVSVGHAEWVQAMYRNVYLPKRHMMLNVPRSKLPLLPLVDQTKTFFRQIPAMMWIVSTSPAHGSDLAFTATSVTVPAALLGMIYFNIAHSSAFFAGFGGIGSTVRTFALSTKQKDLAHRYVQSSKLESEDVTRFESESMVRARCVVEHVNSVQDHHTVLARIEEVVLPTDEEDIELQPLVWQNGVFLT